MLVSGKVDRLGQSALTQTAMMMKFDESSLPDTSHTVLQSGRILGFRTGPYFRQHADFLEFLQGNLPVSSADIAGLW